MTDGTSQITLNGFGIRLKAAREAANLSEKDIGIRLHLNPNVIQSIESENFTDTAPATFMRGYIRSYARLLNFSEAEVSTILDQSGLKTKPSSPSVTQLESTPNFQSSDSYVHWFTYLIILVSFILVGIWWNSHSRNSTPDIIATTTPPPPVPTAPVAQQPAVVVANPPTAAVIPTVNTTVPAPAAITTTPVQNNAQLAPSATGTTNNPQPATVLVDPLQPAAPPGSTPAPTQSVSSADEASPTAEMQPTEDQSPRQRKRSHEVSGMEMAVPEPGLEP